MGREQYKTPRQLALEISAKRDAISAEIESIVGVLEVSRSTEVLCRVSPLANQRLGSWWPWSER